MSLCESKLNWTSILGILLLLLSSPSTIARVHAEDVNRCGEYRLERESVTVGFSQRDQYLLNILYMYDDGGRVIKTLAYRDLEIAGPCKDITGDGVLELLVEGHTGGNPGYWVSALYSMGEEVKNLLVFTSRTGIDFSDMKNLDRDPALEILTYESSLAGLPGLISARSPAVLMVLCLKLGRYQDCTKHFPKLLEKEIEKVEAGIRTTLKDSEHPLAAATVRALAAEFFALHYLLGREDDGREKLVDLVPREVLLWVKKHHGRIFHAMGSRAASIYYEE